MANLTKQGMADGVRGAAVFVLFLSRGVLERPFVRFEAGEALKHKWELRMANDVIYMRLSVGVSDWRRADRWRFLYDSSSISIVEF